MSTPANLERLLGGFAWFVEAGLTVDGQVISHLIKPDVTPIENWTDRYLGSILSVVPGTETEDRSWKRAKAGGGWEKVPKTVVISDFIDLKTREMGEQLLRLQFGLATAIVEDAAQTPYAKSTRSIEGWLRLQAREEPGNDLMILDYWATMELTKGLLADGNVSEPEFKLTVQTTVDGALVAGNSIIFPAAA